MSRAERAPRRTDWSANKAPETYTPGWDDYVDVLEGKRKPKDIPRHPHQPQFGYWRVKIYKPGTSSAEMRKAPHGHEPLAFMPWGEGIVCKLGNHTNWGEFEGVCSQWEKAKLVDPITVEEYKHWTVTGKWQTVPRGWDDVTAGMMDPNQGAAMVDLQPSAAPENGADAVIVGTASGRKVTTSDNQPPADTPYSKAVEFIDGKARDIAEWILKIGKVSNADQLETAQKHRDILIKTRTTLERVRKEEKAPHIAAGNAVDDRYNALKAQVEAIEKSVNDAVREFAIAEDARIKREKAEADRIAAEQARKAREELESAEMSRTICDDAAADKHEEKAAVAIAAASEARAAPAKLAVGSTGRKITVKNVVTAKIEDYDAALAFFKNNDKIREIVQSQANTIIKAGGTVPGCSRDERPDI